MLPVTGLRFRLLQISSMLQVANGTFRSNLSPKPLVEVHFVQITHCIVYEGHGRSLGWSSPIVEMSETKSILFSVHTRRWDIGKSVKCQLSRCYLYWQLCQRWG